MKKRKGTAGKRLARAFLTNMIGVPTATASYEYKNWAELAENEVNGKDYMVRSKSNLNSAILHISIHGGGIEGGTSEIVQEISGKGNVYNYYELDGMKIEGNSNLHISSTAYDEPVALEMVRDSLYTISYHGYYEPNVKRTLMGGADIELRNLIMEALQLAGYSTMLAPDYLGGDDPTNITNKNKQNAGVQLELSTAQRQAFFKDKRISRGSRKYKTEEFFDYTNVIKKVLERI